MKEGLVAPYAGASEKHERFGSNFSARSCAAACSEVQMLNRKMLYLHPDLPQAMLRSNVSSESCQFHSYPGVYMHKEWGELVLRMGRRSGKPGNQKPDVAFAFLSRLFHTPYQ